MENFSDATKTAKLICTVGGLSYVTALAEIEKIPSKSSPVYIPLRDLYIAHPHQLFLYLQKSHPPQKN